NRATPLNRLVFWGGIQMSPYGTDRQHRVVRALGLAVIWCVAAIGIGCAGAISNSHNQPNGDPLHLGAAPGPLGSPTPQTIELRLGSDPSDRIVSLSLTASSLKAVNSGDGQIDLLTAPVTFEFTNNAIVTQPIFVGPIYEDTYSALVFPDMTGQVVFYDVNGNLVTQALNISGQTVSLTAPFVLDVVPQVLNVSIDLAGTFTVNDNSVAVNSIAFASSATVPVPAVNQPETGSSSFLVGTATAADTVNH